MHGHQDQSTYWDTVGATKTFTHPIELGWLAGVRRDEPILDYGCGYGRVAAELADRGFSDLAGVDLSPALIARARHLRPDLTFEVLESPPTLPSHLGRFKVVLLIAVLTCVVDDRAQRAIVAETTSALVPGGLLYVSDLLLQHDATYRSRYESQARQGTDPYGVFATGDGAVCRHHDLAHLRSLTVDLDEVEQRELDVVTMNGNRARAVQLLLRKP